MTVDFSKSSLVGQAIGYAIASSGSRTALPLNAAYTYGSAGAAIAIRFNAMNTSGINKFYVFVDSVSGTAANVSLKCEIRNEHASTSTQPGSTVLKAAVTSSAVVSAGHWAEFDFSASPYVPAVGETLWAVIYNDAGAPATDFPSVIVSNALLAPWVSAMPQQYLTFSTTGGFSSAGSATQGRVCCVEYVNGYTDGHLITRSTATFFTSNQRERGIVIDGLDVATYVYALIYQASLSTSINGVKIYGPGSSSGTQAPGGTTYATYNLGSDTGQSRDRLIGSKIISPLLLAANSKYRVVFTFTANSQTPSVAQIESMADYTALGRVGMYGNALGYMTIDDGAGGWTDDKSIWGGIGLSISSYVPSSGGGLLVRQGMTGGFEE